jgi:hypothetical protein
MFHERCCKVVVMVVGKMGFDEVGSSRHDMMLGKKG